MPSNPASRRCLSGAESKSNFDKNYKDLQLSVCFARRLAVKSAMKRHHKTLTQQPNKGKKRGSSHVFRRGELSLLNGPGC